MKRLLIPALAPLLLLVACEQKTAAPAAPTTPAEERTVATPANSETTETAYQHDPKVELTGFYFTETPVQVEGWKLTSLDIGQPSDFADWESGKRTQPYAPIFLALDDTTSATAENELGQTYHTVNMRILPDSYHVDGEQVTFRSTGSRFGEVVLELTPDLAAYKKARSSGPNGGVQKQVFTGSLQIGAERIRNLRFFYHPGE